MLPIPLLFWFEWLSKLFGHNLLNFVIQHSKGVWCLASFTLHINAWHSLKFAYLSPWIAFLHMCLFLTHKVLWCYLIVLIHSFISCFSAFLITLELLGVLIVFISLRLTAVIPFLKHLRINLLWFLKSVIFLTRFSHFHSSNTISLPNSFLYAHVSLSFFLIQCISRTIFSKVVMKRKFWRCRQAFTMS